MRRFEDKPAVRDRVPLLIGLIGPSGGGKTLSALRLATGIKRIAGGEVFFVDTEARRALHYADDFDFRHVEFAAPFSPDDYIAALQHCVDRGATTVIVDSMSHEHEGSGGVLEMHAQEHERLGGRDNTKFLSWAKPKAARGRLINAVLQMRCNFIFCFRAKTDAIKPPRKGEKQPKQLGIKPIGGDEFIYEMTVNCLLPPGAGGVPQWNPEHQAEKVMTKLPNFAGEWFASGRPLDEEAGETAARWAEGAKPPTFEELIVGYESATTRDEYSSLERGARVLWRSLDNLQRRALNETKAATKAAIVQREAAGAPPSPAAATS